MEIRSTSTPDLRLHIPPHESVKFSGGVATVTDKDTIAALRKFEHLGIEVPAAGKAKSESVTETGASGVDPNATPVDDSGNAGNPPKATAPVPGENPPSDPDDREQWDEEKLRAFAAEKGIDLGKVQKLPAIRERITKALASAEPTGS